MKKTIMEQCREGRVPRLIKSLAESERMPVDVLARSIAQGTVVVPANIGRRDMSAPCAIGAGCRVKINANLGTSPDREDHTQELEKLRVAEQYGADTVMDLSVGPELNKTREVLLQHANVPLGTVPVYEAIVRAEQQYGQWQKMNDDDMFAVLESQARQGVDFFTIHCGITRHTLRQLARNPRSLGIVSRGGAILAQWMKINKQENPFYRRYDDILKIARRYDIVISLGDGLRPGSVLDATDKPQLAELRQLGTLAERARAQGVQVMIEGPGHVPLNQVARNVRLQKKYCHNAPFYVLGPLVTDSAMGYDHISAAIGSCVAAMHGADFLCFVTPAEHVRLPDIDDIRQGVIASKIAAHGADIARGNAAAWERDTRMSLARGKRDWPTQIALAPDPEKVRQMRSSSLPEQDDVCTMCGKYCSMKMTQSNQDAPGQDHQ